MNTQPPSTYNSKTRQISSTQAVNQYRPASFNSPADAPAWFKKFLRDLDATLRQLLDLIYQLRDLFTPLALVSSGTPTDDPIAVPVEADATDRGTSLGVSVTLNRVGQWLVSCSVCLQIDGDTDLFTLSLLVDGAVTGYTAYWQASGDGIIQFHQQWLVTSLLANENLTLRMKKAAGAGTSAVIPGNTVLSASWAGLQGFQG